MLEGYKVDVLVGEGVLREWPGDGLGDMDVTPEVFAQDGTPRPS